MGGKLKATFLIALLALIIIPPAYAQIYLGTVEGYVLDANDNTVSGASVTATVSGCSGGGCSGSTTSQSNGYYVIANLNLQPGGTVVVTATKSGASGTNSGTADPGSAAYVNVTLCPSSPTGLTAPSGSHNLTAQLSWTSGSEISSQTPYDEYSFNGGAWSVQTSPVYQLVPGYNTAYNWQVRTCNSKCCSSPASSSVTIVNTQPTQPSLVDQPNTHDTNVTLCWTSGTDSDTNPTDVLHDEFYFDDDSDPEDAPIYSNTSISPGSHCLSFDNLVYGQTYYWRVKTCDGTGAPNECNWDTDSFTITNTAPSAPTLVDQGCASSDSVTLSWTSGTDAEGDPTYDEFQFGVDGNYSSTVSPATSPQIQTGLSSCQRYTWRVRTCDNLSCSAWAEDSFNTCFATSTGGGSGGSRGGGTGAAVTTINYITSISAPLYVGPGETITVFVNYKSSTTTDKVKMSISGVDFSFQPVILKNVKSGEERTVAVTGVVDSDAKLGERTLTFSAYVNDDIVITKHFKITVGNVIVPVCGNGICEAPIETPATCIEDCHCGNRICEAEYGESFSVCPSDCLIAPFLPAWIGLIFVICTAIIYFLVRRYRLDKKKLIAYIKRQLKRGVSPQHLFLELHSLGWLESTLEDIFKSLGYKIKKGKRGIKFYKSKE